MCLAALKEFWSLKAINIELAKDLHFEDQIIVMIICYQGIALMNQTMFLKFILLNQNMFRMKHHPSSVVQ